MTYGGTLLGAAAVAIGVTAIGGCGGAAPVRTPSGAELIIDGSSMMLLEDGEIVPIEVHFEVDSAELKQESLPVLDAVAQLVETRDVELLEVQGHADERGTDAHNEALSLRRAEAVVEYLRQQGIDPERLRARGFGAEQPVAPHEHRRNRRVEFVLVDG